MLKFTNENLRSFAVAFLVAALFCSASTVAYAAKGGGASFEDPVDPCKGKNCVASATTNGITFTTCDDCNSSQTCSKCENNTNGSVCAICYTTGGTPPCANSCPNTP